MAEHNKKDVKAEEISEHSENREMKEKSRKAEDQKPEAKAEEQKPQPKPYIHIDTFLKTAVPMFGLTSVQAAGFKAKMNGQQYQHDEKVFLEKLKEHFNIDQEEAKSEDK